jgi:hypothetical protein
MKINYRNIPVLAIGFTRADDFMARGIQLFRHILKDKAAPNHAFIVTEDHGQLFATEETPRGLEERSLEEYTSDSNRIVAMYKWHGFDIPEVVDHVQRQLAEVRRRAGEDSKYDWKGLLSFLPGMKKFFKPDPKRQWCSENCATILKKYGAPGIDKVEVAPDELLKIMQENSGYVCVLNYYL